MSNQKKVSQKEIQQRAKKTFTLIRRAKKYPEIGATYRHYKGGKYQVLSLAEHSETKEKLVIYRSVHFGSIHARPLKMWFDTVEGTNIKRFELA